MPFSQIVVASETDANQIAQSLNPVSNYSGVACKGIDPVKLGQLHALLEPMDVMKAIMLYDPGFQASDDGPFVTIFPQEAVSKIARLSWLASFNIAQEWATKEEFLLDRWSSFQVVTFFYKLRRLARQAVSRKKGLVLWVSL
jgi:hypothetical protein